jgi:hypothetical protein
VGDRMQPRIGQDGVPRCSDECEQYDGKRCQLLGCRPGPVCEPAVLSLLERVRVAEVLADGYVALPDEMRWARLGKQEIAYRAARAARDGGE